MNTDPTNTQDDNLKFAINTLREAAKCESTRITVGFDDYVRLNSTPYFRTDEKTSYLCVGSFEVEVVLDGRK